MEVVIIPAYKPDRRMVSFVKELDENGIKSLVVDDGSGEEYSEIFGEASAYASIVHHDVNMGKGSALRTGISKVKELFPECTHFTTADADGQHRAEDVVRMTQEPYRDCGMLLTERDFKCKMPLPSWLGNNTSKWVFTLLTGRYYWDNQSGLRRFSTDQADWLLNVKGDKYDYELDMLYYAEKQHIKVDTMPIPSIYIDGNSSSHFDPVKDTLRLYKRLFSSGAASLIAGLLAVAAVILSAVYLGNLAWAGVFGAGVVSAAVCGILNKTVFFRKVRYRDFWRGILRTAIRYAVYAGLAALVCYLLPGFSLVAAYFIMLALCVPARFFVKRAKYFAGKKSL